MLIVFVTVFAALYYAQDVLIPLALAVLVTFVLSPVATWLERWRLPRAAAAVIVVAIVCAFTLALSYVVGDQLVQFGQDLSKYKTEINKKINTFQGTSGGLFGKVAENIGDIRRAAESDEGGGSTRPDAATQSTTTPTPGNPTQATGKVVGDAGRTLKGEAPREKPPVLGSTPAVPIYTRSADTSALAQLAGWFGLVLGPLGTLGLVLVLVLFMLLERDDLRDRFIRLSSGGRYIVTTQALNDATDRISRFLRAQLIVNGTYGIAVAIGLWIIGMTFGHGVTFPSFILWGALCAVLRFIPYVGPWAAAAFPIAVSLAVYEGFGVFIATGVMFVGIELISNNFMEPILYGSSTGISTVALLIAAMLWTSLWGPYGLLLSTPLTVCLVVLGRHVPSLSFLDVLLGDRPALPAGDRFYQRLIAGDGADAAAVAHEYAEQHGAVAAADEVVMPAIRMARQDRQADDLTAEEEANLYRTADEILAAAQEKKRELAKQAAKDAEKKLAERKEGDALVAAPDAEGDAPVEADRPLVIALPSHHRAESIAVALLASLIEPAGGRVETLSCSLLPTDVEAKVAEAKPAAVFIAVLPPGGSTQARYLCRRLHRQFKDIPIVLGYFGAHRNYDALLVRFRASGAAYVTTSIGQARSQLISLVGLKVDPEVERALIGSPAAPARTEPAKLGPTAPLCAVPASSPPGTPAAEGAR